MTKAQKIRELWRQEPRPTTRVIAACVYGEVTPARMSYVRVVTRQRINGASIYDKRYARSEAGREVNKRARKKWFRKRYRSDPEFRERILAGQRQKLAANSALRHKSMARWAEHGRKWGQTDAGRKWGRDYQRARYARLKQQTEVAVRQE